MLFGNIVFQLSGYCYGDCRDKAYTESDEAPSRVRDIIYCTGGEQSAAGKEHDQCVELCVSTCVFFADIFALIAVNERYPAATKEQSADIEYRRKGSEQNEFENIHNCYLPVGFHAYYITTPGKVNSLQKQPLGVYLRAADSIKNPGGVRRGGTCP